MFIDTTGFMPVEVQLLPTSALAIVVRGFAARQMKWEAM